MIVNQTYNQPNYWRRIQTLQAAMQANDVNLVILDFSANFSYLTGLPPEVMSSPMSG